MFRKFLIATIMAMFALVSISRACAAELTGGDAAKRILNSINMTLVLVPAGEFKMGSAESATATASFFNKMWWFGRPSRRHLSRTSTQSTAYALYDRFTWAHTT